ncbi:50S ribosomal protein L25 [Patescibacteria group bacterium]|nr:50S ribosomal protein L25 [Patescibacteria group bacterium]
MVDLNLKAKTRELGRKADLKAGRKIEQIPAVLYGFEQDNTNLWVDGKLAEVLFKEVGRSRLLTLDIEGKDSVKVVIKEAQRDPVTDRIIHLDLYKVDLKKTIDIRIPIHFIGDAPAVKVLGGTLLTTLNRLEIRCLPEDILKDVKVDLSKLETFEEVIHVESLDLPENIEVLTDASIVIASVKPPRVEEVATPSETEEVAEGEESAEGEAKEGEEAKPEGEDKKEEKKD